MNKKKVIDSFTNEYWFLSNFYEVPVEYQGLIYQSSEAAFQAAKLLATEEDVEHYLKTHHLNTNQVTEGMKKKIQDILTVQLRMPFTRYTPSQAKKEGRHCQLREDWEECKDDVMRTIVFNKFIYNDELSDKLIDTDDAILIEGNHWGDTTWGMVNGKGQNRLGKILMELRGFILDEPIVD